MALSAERVAHRARAILTEKPQSSFKAIPTLIALVPLALSSLIDRAVKDGSFYSSKRYYVSTEAITIAAGVQADIAEAINAVGIRADTIAEANIVIGANPQANAAYVPTVEFVNSLDRLIMGATYDAGYTLAFLDGTILYFDPAVAGLVGKDFVIKAPGISKDLSAYTDESLESELAKEVATLSLNQDEANARGLTESSQKT